MTLRSALRVATLALAASAALLATGPARADDDQFSINKITTGHLLPQRMLVSPVPINRTWAEMAPQYQDMVRGLYESLAKDDEPPFPKNGLKWIFTEFERVQEKAAVAGEVLLTVSVDAQGQPQSVKVYKTPHTDVATAAAFLLMKETYKPAKCHGTPCAMDYLFNVTLQVNREVTRSSDGIRNK